MLSSTKLIRVGIVILGVTALSGPAFSQAAQPGNPANPTGTEVPRNVPPKGNIGTSGATYGVGEPGMNRGTTGAGSAMPGGPASRDQLPRGADAPSEVPRPGPKGNIGGN